MSELIDTAAPAPEAPGANQATESIPSSGDGNLSIREASKALSGYREKRDGLEAPPTEDEATPSAGDHSPEPAAPEVGEPAERTQPEKSAIEAPRSWSKEDKEWFAQLPSVHQEILTRRENERDTALRRGQNETATLRQTLDTERKALEQERQQYAQILPALAQQLQQQQQGEFGDIKTQADIDNMARNDWQRFAMWQAHQMKVQNVQQQIQSNYQRSQQEYATKWTNFAQNEDNLFAASVPELSDPVRAKEITEGALNVLRDNGDGFSDSDLNQLWSGQASVSLRDHRLQKIIYKAALYDAAKAGVPAKRAALPTSKTLRPGTPQERASDAQVNLDSLTKNLESSGNWRAGADLLIARRAARRK